MICGSQFSRSIMLVPGMKFQWSDLVANTSTSGELVHILITQLKVVADNLPFETDISNGHRAVRTLGS